MKNERWNPDQAAGHREWEEESLDKRIQNALKREAEQVSMNPMVKEKIWRQTMRQNKEEKGMRIHWKKVVCAASILCMLCVGGVAASGKINGYRSGMSWTKEVYDYTKLMKESCQVGADVRMPEKFTNGYAFRSGDLTEVEAIDKDINIVAKFPELCANYEKANAPRMFYTVGRELETLNPRGEEFDCDGVKLYYNADHYRFVPVSYKISEEEQALIDKGELFVSSGTDSVENKIIKSIRWQRNDLTYEIMILDQTDMEAEEFLQMAKEVISLE